MTDRAENRQHPKGAPTLGEAVDRLAGLVPNGHILAATSATDMLVGACDEIDRLRSTIADSYETVGEDWKTCDATLAEAIAAELGEYDSVNPEELAKLIREVRAARAAVGEGWFTGGATLAEAITRKCRMLEGLNATRIPDDLTRAGLEMERAKNEEIAVLREALRVLVYWHNQDGRIDESWWDNAREALEAAKVGR